MTTYSFNKEMFPSLLMKEFAEGFNSIGLRDLSTVESEILGCFMELLGDPNSEVDDSNVLLLKADDSGIPVKIYETAIFQSQDQERSGLVLKLGANEYPVKQTDGGFKVGFLKGEIAFQDPIELIVKDESGEEKKVDFHPATVNFLFAPDGDFDNTIEYKVQCRWDISANVKPAAIKAKVRANQDISSYFRTVPSGGNKEFKEAGKIQDLGVGSFEVDRIRAIEGGQYGTAYVLTLSDEREVWARGNVQIQCEDKHFRGEPLVATRSGVQTFLIVSEVKQRKDGKWSVTCTLRERKTTDVQPPVKVPVTPVAVVADPIPF